MRHDGGRRRRAKGGREGKRTWSNVAYYTTVAFRHGSRELSAKKPVDENATAWPPVNQKTLSYWSLFAVNTATQQT